MGGCLWEGVSGYTIVEVGGFGLVGSILGGRRAGGPRRGGHNRQGSRLALGEGKQGVCVADFACMGRAVGLRSGRGTGGTMLTTERSTL